MYVIMPICHCVCKTSLAKNLQYCFDDFMDTRVFIYLCFNFSVHSINTILERMQDDEWFNSKRMHRNMFYGYSGTPCTSVTAAVGYNKCSFALDIPYTYYQFRHSSSVYSSMC